MDPPGSVLFDFSDLTGFKNLSGLKKHIIQVINDIKNVCPNTTFFIFYNLLTENILRV